MPRPASAVVETFLLPHSERIPNRREPVLSPALQTNCSGPGAPRIQPTVPGSVRNSMQLRPQKRSILQTREAPWESTARLVRQAESGNELSRARDTECPNSLCAAAEPGKKPRLHGGELATKDYGVQKAPGRIRGAFKLFPLVAREQLLL